MYLFKKYYIYVICVVFLLISSSQVSADCRAWNFGGHCILFDDVPIDEQIEDAVEYVSRCGVNGEGTLYVRNKTRTTKFFKINGLIDGSYDTEITPGKEVKGTFCNRDMVGVEIYSSTECGRTYLGQSKTVRAYTKEAIDLTWRKGARLNEREERSKERNFGDSLLNTPNTKAQGEAETGLASCRGRPNYESYACLTGGQGANARHQGRS